MVSENDTDLYTFTSTNNPVGTANLYWNNNSCSPFEGPLTADPSKQAASCTLGNLAQYAINVTDAESAIAGVKFAWDKNIRLTVKNTGHDLLGRSMGKGSLALWTHNLKEVTFFKQYSSPNSNYTGPATRVGAGIEVQELYEVTAANGYRAVAGSCRTVGAIGGFTQGGGHGPLSSAYGLGADQTLEIDVVTPEGVHLTASQTNNTELYYALSGGGLGNFGVVLSMTVKVFKDGPVAGAQLVWTSDDEVIFMEGVKAWIKHLLVLDTIPGFRTDINILKGTFQLAEATLPDATQDDMLEALMPYYQALDSLNITALVNETTLHDNFLDHYTYYVAPDDFTTRNLTVGGQLVPRSFVSDDDNVEELASALQVILDVPDALLVLLGTNVAHARVGNQPGTNAVSTMWRNSLFSMQLVLTGNTLAEWPDLRNNLTTVDDWEQTLHNLIPGGGAYQSEATFDNPNWREDYYGDNYDKLLGIKKFYDPNNILWNRPAVGHEAMYLDANGRLRDA
jgi:hypothetical protein